MLRRSLTALLVGCVLSLGTAYAEDKSEGAKEPKLDGIKCLFCKMNVKKDVAVDYKGAKIFLGCEGCVGAFEEKVKTDKLVAAKANWQLVATKQAKQKGCPMSGGKVDEKMTVKVGGKAAVEVGFCCGNCKKAAAEMEGDKQILALFNDKAFKKSFVVAKKESDKK